MQAETGGEMYVGANFIIEISDATNSNWLGKLSKSLLVMESLV